MIKTSLPKAIVYGLGEIGQLELRSTVYSEEYLEESVVIYSENQETDFLKHFAIHRPDVVLTIGGDRSDYPTIMAAASESMIASKWCHHSQFYGPETIANDIVKHATDWACSARNLVYNNPDLPFFSVFTPAYKTEERIKRTYESVKNQTYPNWEWIVVDDSPQTHNVTWGILQGIAAKDHRVKIFRMMPTSGGNIGEVKNRATSMANGGYLVELDHDDYLLPTLMEETVNAIKQYPEAGFFYTNVAEPYEDGEMRQYTNTIGPKEVWYANPENSFVWAYGGHEWVEWNGTQYLSHVYPSINPKTIRFNIGMPNHARIWKKDVYDRIGGHNKFISVADDYELIVRTFLNTEMVHINKLLYLQYNNRNSTVDNNAIDINRKARLIRDHYDQAIHNRITELGFEDWDWIEEEQRCHPFQFSRGFLKYYDEESVLNKVYE